MRADRSQIRLFCRHRCAALARLPSLSLRQPRSREPRARGACAGDDSGLTLPAGFCATIFADGIGHARHLVVAENGVVYVNTWSGRYFGNDTPHAGGFLVALKDTKGVGKADVNERFGETVQSGGAGGTGIGIYKGWLYAELNDKILKYPLKKAPSCPATSSQVVVQRIALGRRSSHASFCDRRRRATCMSMLRARPILARKKIAR